MDDFIGEIRYFCFDYVPEGWYPCDGRALQIARYTPLFAVIGIAYGGDGKNTFQIPNLQGRAGLGALASHTPPFKLGQVYGHDAVTLQTDQLPTHTHQLVRPGGGKPYEQKINTPSATTALGSLALLGGGNVNGLVTTDRPDMRLNGAAVAAAGGGQSHPNVQPYQVFMAGICYDGVFPPRP